MARRSVSGCRTIATALGLQKVGHRGFCLLPRETRSRDVACLVASAILTFLLLLVRIIYRTTYRARGATDECALAGITAQRADCRARGRAAQGAGRGARCGRGSAGSQTEQQAMVILSL